MPDDKWAKYAAADSGSKWDKYASVNTEAQQISAGLPGIPKPQVNMQESNLATAASAPKMGLESGLPSPAQVPTNVGPMQTGAIAGSAIANPITTIGALGTGYLAGKGNRAIAQKLGAGPQTQNVAEGVGNVAGGIVGGGLGSLADAPLMQWLTSSRSVGAQLLQQASAKAGNAPVELSPRTNELVDNLVQQQKLGGKPIKVIGDLLERVGPSTKDIADAQPGPLTYNEARILQSNMSKLTVEESMGLKGTQKYLLKQLAGSFSQDVQVAADRAGVGGEHLAGMKEYASASSRNTALAKAIKYGAGGVAGAGTAYEALKFLKGKQ